MNQVLAAVSGALFVAGLMAIIAWAIRASFPQFLLTTPAKLWKTLTRLAKSVPKRTWIRALLGITLGIVIFGITGWFVLLLTVPAAIVGLPILFAAPPNRDIEMLESLDRWVRTLATIVPTGKSVMEAIRLSERSAPAMLAPGLHRLRVRVDDQTPTKEALFGLADDWDSPDSDAVVAALILAAARGGVGITATLRELADSIQHRLSSLREISAERAKPRVVVRQVTLVTTIVMFAALTLGGDFFQPYDSWLGQIVLAALLTAYLGSLLILRRLTLAPPRERVLQSGEQT
ncbi:MAG: hypothetical protein CR980_00420 [Propionibacteriales bacterium]|nr:MAG: hypothetical protein CR980_00420 [Propionibacteriales bacterium]